MSGAIFLDRDGTINIDKNYVYKIEDWEFLPHALEGLQILSLRGYKLVIITNQSGIGRGYYTCHDMEKLHNHVIALLEDKHIAIAGIYYCPHTPSDNCSCRKPETELLKKAATDLNINITESYFIGDKTCDIKMGIDGGCKTIMVKTGKGGKDGEYDVLPDFTVSDLYEAATLIIRGEE
ncbi:MAG: D-glycero-beta-D-manno-heptose 1,7-bisphosphate 7-phosphatase [Candidatus Eremiobacterota bacterium]